MVFDHNITHNLVNMAECAGVYNVIWRPEESGISTAKQLIEPLKDGLAKMLNEAEEVKKHEPKNQWGTYDGLFNFVASYLAHCLTFPDASVRVSR